MGNDPNICELHSFSTSPNLCHHLTVLNANVPNCYIMPKLLLIDRSHWRPQFKGAWNFGTIRILGNSYVFDKYSLEYCCCCCCRHLFFYWNVFFQRRTRFWSKIYDNWTLHCCLFSETFNPKTGQEADWITCWRKLTAVDPLNMCLAVVVPALLVLLATSLLLKKWH